VSDDAEFLRALRSPSTDPKAAREALHALGKRLTLERLEELLVDPSVLAHPAAGVRRDAACALGMIGTCRPELLIDLLEDDDMAVARSAWLSLWMLTGHPYGQEQDDLFAEVPAALATIDHVRDGLFTRPGVSAAQRVATEAMIRDDLRRADAAQRFRELVADHDAGTAPWPAWAP
jgi:HEAT repeat protein